MDKFFISFIKGSRGAIVARELYSLILWRQWLDLRCADARVESFTSEELIELSCVVEVQMAKRFVLFTYLASRMEPSENALSGLIINL